MTHVNMPEVLKLMDTIQCCEIAVARLKNDPPLTLNYEEVQGYLKTFTEAGAKALTEYYRLTSPLFSADEAVTESA